MRNKYYYQNLDQMNIQKENMFPSPDLHPILFEDVYINVNNSQNAKMNALENKTDSNGVHLFILCHGFQGNSFDMRLFKNNIALLYPDSLFLCSKTNEDFTDYDIQEMGRK